MARGLRRKVLHKICQRIVPNTNIPAKIRGKLLSQCLNKVVIDADGLKADLLATDGTQGRWSLEERRKLLEEGRTIEAGQMVTGFSPHWDIHPFDA